MHLRPSFSSLRFFSRSRVWGQGIWTLTLNIWHPPCRVLSLKTTPTMPPRTKISNCLTQLEDEAPQPSTHNPSTQRLTSIAEGLEHEAFDDILEVQLQHPTNNASTVAAGSSQNTEGNGSTQINGSALHQLPLWAPSPLQVIQGNIEPKQI
jgi:hypothetical protein